MWKRYFVKKDDCVRENEGIVDERRDARRAFVSEGNEHVESAVFGRVAKQGRDARNFVGPIIARLRRG